MNATANNIQTGKPEMDSRHRNLSRLERDAREQPRQLPEKLYLAAKRSKTRRFHALYDKVYREDILKQGWEQVKSNRGKPGVDGESISDIQKAGETEVLTEIQQTLKTGKYRPKPVRRVYIPKPDGRHRPLGIPTIRDRIVQSSAKIVLEPIFEADFLDCSYGFRPKRRAHDALELIRVTINQGYNHVLDADIKGYFDHINHEKLLDLVQHRISDRRILKLIRQWLTSGIVEEGDWKPTNEGTPQGGVISPLLANIYLHELDKAWTQQTEVNGKLVRYADDFVILFKTQKDAEKGQEIVQEILAGLGLELHPTKTRLVNMKNGRDGFDFLGFHFRKVMSHQYHRYYTQKWPSHKAMNVFRGKIRAKLAPKYILNQSIQEVVDMVNPLIRGWMNYFKYGNSSRQFHNLDSYIHERMALWWSKKHQKGGRGWTKRYTLSKHCRTGIQRLTGHVEHWSCESNGHG